MARSGWPYRVLALRELLRNVQLWIIALLGVLPAAAYLIYGIFFQNYLGQQFSGRFIPALLLSPLNYMQWESKASLAAGGIFIMLGLLGFFLAKERWLRIFLCGLWGAYLLYGLFFDYHIATHDYYQLPFIPIVAISLAPFGDWLMARLAESASQRWMRSAVYLILAFGILSAMVDVRNQLKSVDYRPEAAMWAEIGQKLGQEARVVALTQDYGSRLEYWGWITPAAWPYVGDINYSDLRGGKFSFNVLFKNYAGDREFFLVTDFDELKRQPELKQRLVDSYPVYAQGDDYEIFDLWHPLQKDGNGS